MIRAAAVAGVFYPKTKSGIEDQINGFDTGNDEQKPAFGIVAPHAGYLYSGAVAAKAYSMVKTHGSVILIGPNHGAGMFVKAPPVAIVSKGVWELPTGPVEVDERLATLLMNEADLLTDSPAAHEKEHSLEVQIPFLTHFNGDIKIVPIILGRIPDKKIMDLAEAIYRGVKRFGEDVTLVASTDFSHYIPSETAERLDHMAIEKIEKLDGQGLIDIVRKEDISMCGVQPTALVIEVCKRLGARLAELVEYKTSGDTTGDLSSVVGYGGLVIR